MVDGGLDYHTGSGAFRWFLTAYSLISGRSLVADANDISFFAARDAHVAGRRLQPRLVRLAVLEQERTDERELDRRTGQEVVVGGQQLAHPFEASVEAEEGLVPPMSLFFHLASNIHRGSFQAQCHDLPFVILDMCTCVIYSWAHGRTSWRYNAARLTSHWNPARQKSSELVTIASQWDFQMLSIRSAQSNGPIVSNQVSYHPRDQM